MDDHQFLKKPRRRISVPSLIAWLSLCLLAAAWGHALDPRWQTIWANIGAFGLTAAVGLSSLDTARATRRRWEQNRTLQMRIETRVTRFNDHSATLDALEAAIGRLKRHAKSTSKHRAGATLTVRFPLEVTPIEEQGEAVNLDPAATISCHLRQISSRVVTFEHADPLSAQLVLLTVRLSGEERVSFVVDLMWTEKDGEGYVSRGAVLAVGVPSRRADEQLEPVGAV